MSSTDTIVAVYNTHAEAEAAIRKIAASGFDMKHFSIIGKGYHTEEKVIGFYSTGDRVQFWGRNGALWAGCGACCSAA
ncbi:MAG: general stress protein [Acetobacteraceae bacterium]